MKPQAPRMVTVVAALALTFIGLALIYLPGSQVADLLRLIPLEADTTRQLIEIAGEDLAPWAALLLSPVLLIVGSLVKGV